ncbi:MAG: 4-hydroxy-tetrahydrodipicolinate synthase [Bacillota bacterium]
MYKESFGEVLTAMITPFAENGEVNYNKVAELANYLVENGSDALVVLGTTAEVPTLNHEEKINILKTVVAEVGKKAKVIANTGSYSTSESVKMTKEAEKIGVDGVMAVVPYYNKPPQRGLYNHFSTIAKATNLPLMIYNVPSRTSRNIEVETVEKLSKIENIIAIKEASGNLNQVAKLCSKLGDDFYVYSGDDNLTLPILSVGGQGVVSVASHLVGNDIKSMINYFKNGDLNKAIKLNKSLFAIFNGIFIDTNPIPVKEALNLRDMEVGQPRSPLTSLKDEDRKKLKKILSNYNLI